MLYGRRLDQALQHVDGSRYALVHAVAKRAARSRSGSRPTRRSSGPRPPRRPPRAS